MRNDIRMCFRDGHEWRISHFKMSEFENPRGYVMVDDSVLRSLEGVRESLGKEYEVEVEVLVTDGSRTDEDNEKLAAVLGWCEDGGLVAKDSQHLEVYGGIAVDIVARYRVGGAWVRVEQSKVAVACRDHFEYVKADYEDGHVHADNRKT